VELWENEAMKLTKRSDTTGKQPYVDVQLVNLLSFTLNMHIFFVDVFYQLNQVHLRVSAMHQPGECTKRWKKATSGQKVPFIAICLPHLIVAKNFVNKNVEIATIYFVTGSPPICFQRFSDND